MRRILAAMMLAIGLCVSSFAQFLNTDPDAPMVTSGNFGNETVQGAGALGNPGTAPCPAGVPNGQPAGSINFGCFGFLEQWNDMYVSPYGAFWSVSASVTGVNGAGCCRSTDYNLFPKAPILVYAIPTTNRVAGWCGGQKCSAYQWYIVRDTNGNPVPVIDEFGKVVTFTPVGSFYNVGTTGGYHMWSMNANIPTCVLDATGTTCALDASGNPTLIHYAVDFEGMGATGLGGEIPESRYLFIRSTQSPPAAPPPPPCIDCGGD